MDDLPEGFQSGPHPIQDAATVALRRLGAGLAARQSISTRAHATDAAGGVVCDRLLVDALLDFNSPADLVAWLAAA